MAYYALLDENNIVTQVISGIDEDDTSTLPSEFSSWEEFYGNYHGQTCKRTSYNTKSNVHEDGGTPFRGNYAGPGHVYDVENDVFYRPQPFDSWTLNTDTWQWEAPVAYPEIGVDYDWNEDTQSWDLVE